MGGGRLGASVRSCSDDRGRRLFPAEIESGELRLCDDADAALGGADALAICTEWRAFRMPDFEVLRVQLKQPVIFDGRNVLDPVRAEREGITYYGIGAGSNHWVK